MKLTRILLSIVSCAVMATCTYSRNADGTASYTGGVELELPTNGYAK